MKKLTLALASLTIIGVAHAKLPPPTPEAQAAAELAKDKAAWGNKVAAYKLCLVQNKVAERYLKSHGAAKKTAADVPPCADPGPYVAQAAASQVGVADAKPVPAAGKPAPAKK